MHIFADHCINNDLINYLIQSGFKVERAIDKKLHNASDDEIFKYVIKNSRILLTFDKDFGNIIRFNIEDSMDIVIVYIEEMAKEEIIHKTVKFFQNTNKNALRGSLFIIDSQKIRVWHH